MKVIIIAALSEDKGIGRNNSLLFRIREDMRRFRNLTLGHYVLMGRRTYESIPGGLPGRELIVLSQSGLVESAPGVKVVSSLQEGLCTCASDELYVVGGGRVYSQFLPYATQMFLTRVSGYIGVADVYFPEFSLNDWLVETGEWREDALTGVRFRFEDYTRIVYRERNL